MDRNTRTILTSLQSALANANKGRHASQDGVFGQIWDAIEMIDPGRASWWSLNGEWVDDRGEYNVPDPCKYNATGERTHCVTHHTFRDS